MGSRVTTIAPSTRSSVEGGMETRAIATLSSGCRWMAEFSAVGSLAISRSIETGYQLSAISLAGRTLPVGAVSPDYLEAGEHDECQSEEGTLDLVEQHHREIQHSREDQGTVPDDSRRQHQCKFPASYCSATRSAW